MALVAVLHRFGLTGWVLSLVGAATMFFVQPVVQTLGYGQLGIFLVALVALDLVPGPRVLPRRLLPEGVLTGLAAAIKLTPAIFLLYLLLAGKRRAFVVATLSAVAATLASAAIVPRASLDFWGRLAQGDTGLGGSIIYYTNQSVMADHRPGARAGHRRGPARACARRRWSPCSGCGPRCVGTGWVRSGSRSTCAGWPGCWPPRCPGCTTSSGWCRWG